MPELQKSLRLSKLSVGCDAGSSSLGDKSEQVFIGSNLLVRHLKTDLRATNLHIRIRCLGNYGNTNSESSASAAWASTESRQAPFGQVIPYGSGLVRTRFPCLDLHLPDAQNESVSGLPVTRAQSES